VWCRRLQLSLGRALFNLQHNGSFDLDTSKYRQVFNYWLSNPSPREETNINDFPPVVVDSKWTWLIQDGRDMYFNFMENDSITVVTFLVMSVVISNQMPSVSI